MSDLNTGNSSSSTEQQLKNWPADNMFETQSFGSGEDSDYGTEGDTFSILYDQAYARSITGDPQMVGYSFSDDHYSR